MNVRDIGGFEDAKRTLEMEASNRKEEERNARSNDVGKDAREKSLGKLLNGLKELEHES